MHLEIISCIGSFDVNVFATNTHKEPFLFQLHEDSGVRRKLPRRGFACRKT